MPFTPAPEGSVRCVHNFTVQGQECLCVVYVHVSESPSAADLLDLANEMFDAWSATLLADQSNEIMFNYVQVTDVEVENGLQATSTRTPAAGQSANASCSNALAGVISLRTPFSGRSNRGRIYVPGLRIDKIATDSNYWATDFVTEMNTDSTAWWTAVEGITLGAKTVHMIVLSYFTIDPDIPAPPRTVRRELAVGTGVTSVIFRSRIGTQRRRRPRS